MDTNEPQPNDGFETRPLKPHEARMIPSDRVNRPEYNAPWVVELRIVGTPTVLQVRVDGEVVIGRSDPRNDVQPELDMEAHNGYRNGVSRRHASVFAANNRLMLVDMNSANGTYLNGKKLIAHQQYRVQHGDTITFGKLDVQVFFAVMPISTDHEDKSEPIRFEIPVMGYGENMLVVDDDRDMAYVLGSVLEQAGFNVTVVRSYAEAVSALEKTRPLAVVMQLMLPDRSGLELVQYVRDKMQDDSLPLIVISDVTAGYQMGQAIDAGADVFLSQPVGIDELLRGIGKITASAS